VTPINFLRARVTRLDDGLLWVFFYFRSSPDFWATFPQ
jgi:hypothetical protein